MKKKSISIKDAKVISYASLCITTLLTHKIGDIEITFNHVSYVNLDSGGNLRVRTEDNDLETIKVLGVLLTGKNAMNFMSSTKDLGINLYERMKSIDVESRIKDTLPVEKLTEVLRLMGN